MASGSEDNQRLVINRLKRARGQLDGVISALEGEGTCREIITQLAAVSKALDRAGFLVISSAMQNCLEGDPQGEVSVAELEKLFLSLA